MEPGNYSHGVLGAKARKVVSKKGEKRVKFHETSRGSVAERHWWIDSDVTSRNRSRSRISINGFNPFAPDVKKWIFELYLAVAES